MLPLHPRPMKRSAREAAVFSLSSLGLTNSSIIWATVLVLMRSWSCCTKWQTALETP